MIWRERVRAVQEEIARLPRDHTCVVAHEDEETFSWFVQIEGDGENEAEINGDEEDEDDEVETETERPWCCLSVRGTSATIELARVAAERTYRDLLVAYERLTSSRLDA